PAPRHVRARAVGAATPQGHHVARGARPRARPDVPRAVDAAGRAGGRRGGGRGDVLLRRDPPGARRDRGAGGPPPWERELTARVPAADPVSGRLYPEPRPRR